MASRSKDEARIKFIADTAEFTSGIQSCNSSLSGLRSELKLNSVQMAGAGQSVELLRQRQSTLKQELEEASKKVELTSQKLEAAKRIYGEDSEEVQRLTRQLTEAKAQEQAIQNELDSTNEKIKDQTNHLKNLHDTLATAGDKVQAFGDKVSDVGGKLSVLSAGIVAVGTAAVTAAVGVEDGLANVSTLLTGTVDEVSARVAEMKDETISISNETGIAATELTSGLYQVVSAYGDTAESAQITAVAARAAAAGQAKTTDAVNLLSAVTKAYGDTSLAANQKVSDMAFTTVRLGQTTFPELASSMQRVTSTSNTMGVSQEELFGTFAGLTGVIGGAAEVSTKMQQALNSLLKPSDAMAESLSSLGYESGQAAVEELGLQGTLLALYDTVNQDDVAFGALFGSTEALTFALAEVGPNAEVIAEKIAAMGDATGATDTAFERMQTTSKDVKDTLNVVKNTLVTLGDTILTAAQPIIQAFGEKVQSLSDWFNGLDESTRTQIVTVAALVAAVGPVVVVVGKVISGVGTLISVFSMVASPVGIVIAVIGALVAAGVALYQNWDTVCAKANALKTGVLNVWNGIKSGISSAVSAVVSTVTAKFEAVKYAITHPIETAKSMVGAAIEGIKSFFNITLKFSGIKLPHISIGWKTTGVIAQAAKLLGLQGVPSFSVQWYAKGAVFDRPTLLAGGSGLSGVGEAGPEAVAPISVLQSYVAAAVEASIGGARLDRLISIVETIAAKDYSFSVDSTKLAQTSAGSFDAVNGQRMHLQDRGLVL